MYSAGDLVLIPFPYADLSAIKRRPVLLLTAPDKNGDVICLAVTSRQSQTFLLEITNERLLEGKLPKSSWVRLDKIFTLEADKIEKTFARISAPFFEQVVRQVCQRIGYTPSV